jgi:VanZ family protein
MRIKYILFIVVYLVVLTFFLLHPKWSGSIFSADTAALLSIETTAPICLSLLHFIAFLPLSFCVSQISSKKSIVIGFILLILYAAATEMLQEYIPPRAFRYEDLAQDFAGIIVGLFFGYYLKHVRERMNTDEN